MGLLRRIISGLGFLGAWAVFLWGAGTSVYQGTFYGWNVFPQQGLSGPLRRGWEQQRHLVTVLIAQPLAQATPRARAQALQLIREQLALVPLSPHHWQALSREQKDLALENLTVLLAHWVLQRAREYVVLQAPQRNQWLEETVSLVQRWWLPSLLPLVDQHAGQAQPSPQSIRLEAEVVRRVREHFRQHLEELSPLEKLHAGAFLMEVGRRLQQHWAKQLRPLGRMPGDED